MKKLYDNIINLLAAVLHFCYNHRTSQQLRSVRRHFYSQWIAREFQSCGTHPDFWGFQYLHGAKYCSIGNHVKIGHDVVLEVYDKYGEQRFSPSLTIGNNSNIGDGGHITCINKVEIGNNVRTGRRIFITDNAHGASDRSLMDLSPRKRPLTSKGAVVIHDNVWIGEMVCIMPGVEIGQGSIIGANAVVTKDVPPYTVWAGNPARMIKNLQTD